ncbi:MAG: 4-(cytidine 5'-diphospho)-2-C-methyl-D-erythritol kinase [Alphaproteobacteria bacterium]|uniref:4-diphosphocytidyl-2-C-methyl-D-erythritol kinase n=1 Tax=PS1 clade bacterium TaxID=2175152 RepID=A0A368DSE4_9PROT|nr:4-(cytidine 5'-diphospho)-2-C-methyl-D-erythritol kinase [Rhodobiaceae bacterium]OUT73533.1 MAG: 4-(cytidine 5'-diphospho)-2-C-methyl-D-erythritol kinase [Rhizobiales bacterium TMED25]RCL74145.1 MAG: 4-(cytidine 5'-diphospho)-2-C-methyl-D-erythritol kinase [PS1 clade bacterium]|tara:strand:+ start:871 stop:1719 length:849 start_codon:yes stop_codon:yes gene_type:complete
MISPRVFRASAKINFTLDVLRKREDGYHQIRSLVAFVDLHDEIHITRSDKLNVSFISDFEEQISQQNNSLTRLHQYLKFIYPKIYNYRIEIKKNIPISAGLGGGSADAAIFLKYLIEDNDLNLTQMDLQEIGFEIGADIPVCFYNRPALINGIGEHITEAKINKKFYLVLVNPMFSISTKYIYKKYDHRASVKNINPQNMPFEDMIKYGKNDLQDVVISQSKNVKHIIDTIAQTNKCYLARMTGSGPTCFGVYQDEDNARINEFELKKKFPKYWIKMVNLIS